MDRRAFLRYACACGAAACGRPIDAAAQAGTDWKAPPRFSRPDIADEEGGLWGLMDREESRLRRSPFRIRDDKLQQYVQDVACRLGGEHCPDIRVYIVHTPVFNANMAPNGMMQVWSGLLLRVENEAQLAAVLGHEIAHYLERHSLERLRDVKSRSALAQVLGLFGVAGAVGQLAVVAGMFGYSRDQERVADAIGISLMHRAGYDAGEASRIWENLLQELKARPDGDPAKTNPLFASHPPVEERRDALRKLAAARPGGTRNEKAFEDNIRAYRFEWLLDEVKRNQYEESIALFDRMLVQAPRQAEVLYSRGEIRRLKASTQDLDAAIADYTAAATAGGEPPETYRGLGLAYKARGQFREARENLGRYVERASQAPDAAMIRSYIEDLGS